MDGIIIGNTTLFLGKLPRRKQECFYILENHVIYPIAYIKNTELSKMKEFWAKLIDIEFY